jgi:type VI secretion system protein ImpC
MNAENFQHKLSRIRPPRVQITYDVHIGNAIEKKELPFVVGVMSDLAGKTDLKPLPTRSFVEIDRDTFDDVLARIGPSVEVTLKSFPSHPSIAVPATHALPVHIDFSSLDHFAPLELLHRATAVGDSSKILADLHLRRQHLNDLVTKLQGNDPLRTTLIGALKSTPLPETASIKALLPPPPPPPPLLLEPAMIVSKPAEMEVALVLTLGSGTFQTPPVVTLSDPAFELVGDPVLTDLTHANIVVRVPPQKAATDPDISVIVHVQAGHAEFDETLTVKATAPAAPAPAVPPPAGLKPRDKLVTDPAIQTLLVSNHLVRVQPNATPREDQVSYALDLLRTFLNDVADVEQYPLLGKIIPLNAAHELQLVEKQRTPTATVDPVNDQDIDLTWLLLHYRIANMDREIYSYLNQILHDPGFQKLEASWRGLHDLVINSETGDQLKIRVLAATKDELFRNLQKAVEADQSFLFKKIYEEEYGTFGGNPYSVLIGDYEFDRTPEDIAGLSAIASVAASAHAPFITAAAPGLLDMESFLDLGVPRDLSKIFQSPAMIQWNSFRQSEDARYVALTLPHYLLRAPYGIKGVPAEDLVDFNEEVSGDRDGHNSFLWGNAAYALAQRITAAYAQFHWTAAIRGVEGGGLVRNLPVVLFEADGGLVVKPPTEVLITDRREKELSDLGFIALCYKKLSDQAAFFGGQSVNKPILYNTDEANANSRLSAQLPYVLAMSRFAHYFKVMMRDKIGSFMTKDNVAVYLNTWIADYVLLNDEAPQSLKATNPLREARVDVFDVPGRPGVYKAVAFLRPHFQLEELTVSMRIVATLPPPALSFPAAAPLLA